MNRKSKETETGTGPHACRPEDLETAYRIHTLAQLVFRHLAATHPWIASVPPWPTWPGPAQQPFAPGASAFPMAWPCCP